MTNHEYARKLLAFPEVPMLTYTTDDWWFLKNPEPLSNPTISECIDPELGWEIDKRAASECEKRLEELKASGHNVIWPTQETEEIEERYEKEKETLPKIKCVIV